MPSRRTVLRTAVVLATGAAVGVPTFRSALAAAPPGAQLVPSLREWTPATGSYVFRTGNRLVVDSAYASQLTQAAATLSDDLLADYGARFTPVVDSTVRTGDVFLTLGATDTALGTEGYRLTVGDSLRIQARTPAGAFLGTRTLLQLLRRSSTIPAGTARDWPRYAERGVHISNAANALSTAFWQQLIREMSYLKMNMLSFDIDYPGVPVAQMQQVAAYAKRYGVTPVPLFGLPSHMDYDLPAHPELDLGGYNLDLSKDAAYTWAHDRIAPLLTAIDSPWWHTSADEYLAGADWDNGFPQLRAYARQRFGANANSQDAFTGFLNTINQQVRAAGKTMRMWNDTLFTPGIAAPLDKNVVIEHWSQWGRPAADLLADGYKLNNTNEGYLYYDVVPNNGGHQLNPQVIYDQFTAGKFANSTVSDDHAGILGAKLVVWHSNAETESQIAAKLFAPERSFAQVLWGTAKPAAAYAGFVPYIAAVGAAPGNVTAPTAPRVRSVVTSKDKSLFAASADGRVMTTSWSATAPGGGWSAWSPISVGASTGRTAPNAVVTAYGDQLFTTSASGRVMVATATAGGWGDWATIPGGYNDGQVGPNAVVSATTLNGHTQLFTTAPDGRVMSTFYDGSWHDWFGIPTGYADGLAGANAVVTATGGQIYTTAANGHVMSTFWTEAGWHGWFAIPTGYADGTAGGGAVVTATEVNGNLQLFTTASNGHVMSTFWSASIPTNGGWHEWFAIPTGYADGTASVGAAVAVTTINGNPQLFTTAPDGHVMSTFWSASIPTNGGWHEWFAIPTGFYDGKAAGAVTVGVPSGSPQIFTAAPDLHVSSTYWSASIPTNGGWHEWFAIPGGYNDGLLRP